MSKPVLLDLFCGAGGAARGYQEAGFYVVGVDIKPQPRYAGDEFVQDDALDFTEPARLKSMVEWHTADFDAIHASPPCQGYSIMHNLPWIRGREYPLLILPTLEVLEATGTPYVIENVMGARHGARGLKKRNLEEHGLKAGYLCGTMFEMPFYRHRLFATNWYWLAPGHPRHTLNLHPRSERYVYGGTVKGLPGGAAGLDVKPRPNHIKDHMLPDNRHLTDTRRRPHLTERRPGSNGAEVPGVGVGHAAGWYLAAEAMGIDWMKRDELTQAIPPAYTRYIGEQLMKVLKG